MDLFKLINPILHTCIPASVAGNKTEPYVMAVDVYSLPRHIGRGGWTWYAGSAGWTYRLNMETLLGLKLIVGELQFTPRVPTDWKSVQIHYRFRETIYRITCLNISGTWQQPPKIFIDGIGQPLAMLKLTDDRREHFVEVKFES